MAIQIEIRGLEEVNRFLRVFPNNVSKEIGTEQFEFMKRVQKSAKLRAPRFTGQLAESISVKKTGKNIVILTVDSPYGIFQETGYKPHIVSRYMNSRAGYRIGDWMDAHGIKGKYMTVSKFHPFIGPALSVELQRLSDRLSESVNKAIRRSK